MKEQLQKYFCKNIAFSNNENCYVIDTLNRDIIPLPIFVLFLIRLNDESGMNLNKKESMINLLQDNGYLLSKKRIKLLEKQYHFFDKHFFNSNIKANINYRFLENSNLIIDNFNNVKQIIFEVTDACNLNCAYCCYGPVYTNYDERSSKSIDFNIIKTTIDYYIPIWTTRSRIDNVHINISFYGGEPLLEMEQIILTIQYLESFNLPKGFFIYSLTTNGTLLKKWADYLIEKNFQLLISLDGDPECNAYRVDHNGQNSFESINKSISYIKTINPEFFHKNIRFNTIFHKKNSLSEIKNFFKNNDLPYPSISELSQSNVIDSNAFQAMFQPISDEFNKLENLIEYYSSDQANTNSFSFFRKYFTQYFENYIEMYNFKKPKYISPTGTCLPGSLKIHITTTGKIITCEKIGHNYSIGVVDPNVGITLFPDKTATDFNFKVNEFLKDCEECYNRLDCKICAFKDGEIKPGERCKEYKTKEDFIKLTSIYTSLFEENTELYQKTIQISIG